ncbi:hypothetical protein VP01_100g7 [Puccinia sorghi]|uniref:Uncharacterized protein n=1 Tax=Puccinia sorghi TaxID=27349 RepID=A0A0L6VV28_9BASI|nr:hypothetical protein VP01_100g7 [Puccinia sorghi]
MNLELRLVQGKSQIFRNKQSFEILKFEFQVINDDNKGVEMEEEKFNYLVALEENKWDHGIKLEEKNLDWEKEEKEKYRRF